MRSRLGSYRSMTDQRQSRYRGMLAEAGPRLENEPEIVLPDRTPPADPYLSLTDVEKHLAALYIGDAAIVIGGHARMIPPSWRDRARRELLDRGLISQKSINLADRTRLKIDKAHLEMSDRRQADAIHARSLAGNEFGPITGSAQRGGKGAARRRRARLRHPDAA